MSKDTYGAIRQMNEAFNGETEFKYVAKVDRANKTQVEKVEVKKTPVITKSLGLDYDVDDSMALVPLDSTEHKKQKREMLKERAKLITGPMGKNPYTHGKATFVTGGGIPGRNRHYRDSSSEEEFDE
jgi:hypothetical protein